MQSRRCRAISCRFAAVQRQNNCWFHIDLREARKRRRLAVFIQSEEKKNQEMHQREEETEKRKVLHNSFSQKSCGTLDNAN